MRHLDLFSGIGGFAIATERVWGEVEHTFCDNDLFCQEILKKHWPNSKIHGDIRQLTTNTDCYRCTRRREEIHSANGGKQALSLIERCSEHAVDILTGGFPCQPFSQAGRKRGEEDDRYLWPEMLRVIQEFDPTWIIGENVAGIINMALEQVCVDLENQGYEVQPFVIPACAVNAPHRRDRVWIVAHRNSEGLQGFKNTRSTGESRTTSKQRLGECPESRIGNVEDTISERGGRRMESDGQILASRLSQIEDARSSWTCNWIEVATELCRVDDGIPKDWTELPDSKLLEMRLSRRLQKKSCVVLA